VPQEQEGTHLKHLGVEAAEHCRSDLLAPGGDLRGRIQRPLQIAVIDRTGGHRKQGIDLDASVRCAGDKGIDLAKDCVEAIPVPVSEQRVAGAPERSHLGAHAGARAIHRDKGPRRRESLGSLLRAVQREEQLVRGVDGRLGVSKVPRQRERPAN